MIRFTVDECSTIIKLSEVFLPKHSSTIFSKAEYDYFYHIILRNSSTQWVFDRIKKFTDSIYPENKADKMPAIFLHRYFKGNAFARHDDSSTHPDQILNVGVCLNNNYEGGNFIVYNPYQTIPKDPGLIYSIDSKREHEITEIEKGERWSLIIFFTRTDLQNEKNRAI